jgi:predicted metalloprotease with PDZ domain
MLRFSSAPSLPQRNFSRIVVATVALLSICAAPMMSGKDAVRLPAEESINLPKMTVKGVPVCSFGIGVVCTRDPVTRKIKRVFISEVLPGSLADENGLKEGDEILAINGRKVAGVEGDIKRGAWLFDQLADREPGEKIDVEVAIRVIKRVTLRAFRPAEAMPPK